ncbi:DUF4178 domain-containing protein [Longirhabdus pacifica]|uniref:DUF4178 domain-containing protein n=1 Tax=Longirhabdus pacifica TaxID=2305227 RepID=UPI001F0BE2AA|nr:DUF4178 domain-containing protein [Longirhabdus pacifica]
MVFSRFFKKKDKETKPSRGLRPVEEQVFHLRVNDIVEYDLEDYVVIGKIVYDHGGYKWYAYQLKGDQQNIWLSAEMDDELELGVYQKVKTKITKVPDKMDMDGDTYYLEEQGTARIVEVDGQAGAVVGQQVQYWEFEADEEERYLSVEKWGGDLEVSKGYPIKSKEIKIHLGS